MSREEVLLLYNEAMLNHEPTGWDPNHPEWTEAVKALLAEQYPDKNFDEGYAHPERPQRLQVIVDTLQMEPIANTRWMRARMAEPEHLARVHTRKHIDFIESLQGRSCWLDIDTTAVSPGSVDAAKFAAGAGVTAVEALTHGVARRAFCAVRPPGHHALAERAMGFCLYNNVAVTAAHARALGMERVLLWDWDLHHGNGTQDIFYSDPNVLFIDTHCTAPFYPGTGTLEELGSGAGEGYTLNVPLPAGSGNATMLAVIERIVRPAAEAFRPDLILISAGFDAHYLDQTFAMDESGFAGITAQMCEIADTFAQGRLVICLEGGYSARSLTLSSHATIRTLSGVPVEGLNVQEEDPGLDALEKVAAFHAPQLARIGS